MNPEVTKIGNKLFDKVELASQRIDLAIIDDLKKGISEGQKQEANLYSDFKNSLNSVIQQARAIEVKYNVLLSNINEPLFQSEKQAKELGLDFKQTDFYKQAQSIIKAIETRKDTIDQIQNNIQKFGF
jgi:translation initiation factor 2B subunit (eIF-2B alpha/beta/delta family)